MLVDLRIKPNMQRLDEPHIFCDVPQLSTGRQIQVHDLDAARFRPCTDLRESGHVFAVQVRRIGEITSSKLFGLFGQVRTKQLSEADQFVGRVSLKLEPLPGSLVTSSRPPIAVAR